MNTITITKKNYFTAMSLIHEKLYNNEKVFVQLDDSDKKTKKIEKRYDEAIKEYTSGKTIYGGKIIKHGK